VFLYIFRHLMRP